MIPNCRAPGGEFGGLWRQWWESLANEQSRYNKMADEVGGRLIRELRVVDLKKELEARSLSKTGSKKDLVERLRNVSVFSDSVCNVCVYILYEVGSAPEP